MHASLLPPQLLQILRLKQLWAEGKSTDIILFVATLRGIDQSVAGILHTTGGSTAAYTRWERFKLAGLNQYAAKRNNSMLRNAVSRQSGAAQKSNANVGWLPQLCTHTSGDCDLCSVCCMSCFCFLLLSFTCWEPCPRGSAISQFALQMV